MGRKLGMMLVVMLIDAAFCFNSFHRFGAPAASLDSVVNSLCHLW